MLRRPSEESGAVACGGIGRQTVGLTQSGGSGGLGGRLSTPRGPRGRGVGIAGTSRRPGRLLPAVRACPAGLGQCGRPRWGRPDRGRICWVSRTAAIRARRARFPRPRLQTQGYRLRLQAGTPTRRRVNRLRRASFRRPVGRPPGARGGPPASFSLPGMVRSPEPGPARPRPPRLASSRPESSPDPRPRQPRAPRGNAPTIDSRTGHGLLAWVGTGPVTPVPGSTWSGR